MKENTKVIAVPQDTVIEMQRLSYEMAARENILTFFFLQDKPINNNKNFAAYQAEYTALNAEYAKLKRELEIAYVLTQADGKKAKWELDYGTGNLTIEVE